MKLLKGVLHEFVKTVRYGLTIEVYLEEGIEVTNEFF
jgi:hypothetical protein